MTATMRLRPHLGTLIFPPVALVAETLREGSRYGSEVPRRQARGFPVLAGAAAAPGKVDPSRLTPPPRG